MCVCVCTQLSTVESYIHEKWINPMHLDLLKLEYRERKCLSSRKTVKDSLQDRLELGAWRGGSRESDRVQVGLS